MMVMVVMLVYVLNPVILLHVVPQEYEAEQSANKDV